MSEAVPQVDTGRSFIRLVCPFRSTQEAFRPSFVVLSSRLTVDLPFGVESPTNRCCPGQVATSIRASPTSRQHASGDWTETHNVVRQGWLLARRATSGSRRAFTW